MYTSIVGYPPVSLFLELSSGINDSLVGSFVCLWAIWNSLGPIHIKHANDRRQKKKSLLTRATSRMIQSVVALQSAHFQLKYALVFERSWVRRTHLFFIWRAVFFAHATGVKCVECLADSKVIACNVDARVKVFGIASNITTKWAVFIVLYYSKGEV